MPDTKSFAVRQEVQVVSRKHKQLGLVQQEWKAFAIGVHTRSSHKTDLGSTHFVNSWIFFQGDDFRHSRPPGEKSI